MEADKSEVDAVRGKYESKLKDMSAAAILADNDLTEYIKRSGKVLFGDNCAGCHGTNGVGVKSKKDGLFAPILNDDDWLYGGKIDDIYATLTNGRQGMMLAHHDTLTEQQIDDVAKYVIAMSEGHGDSEAAGKAVFMSSDCTGCHGADGKGIQAMGSANLTDKIWRFDGSLEGVKRTITYGVNSGDPKTRIAIMPNFKEAGKLSDSDIKKLAVYVYKFGGGQAEAPAVVVPVVADMTTKKGK
jgi:cytochrome c oxidase cbb3-type subunit 3